MDKRKPLSIHTIITASLLSAVLFVGGISLLSFSGVVGSPISPIVKGDESEVDHEEEQDSEKDSESESTQETEKKQEATKKETESQKEAAQKQEKVKKETRSITSTSTTESVSSAAIGENDNEDDTMKNDEETNNEVTKQDEGDSDNFELFQKARKKVMEAEKEILEGVSEGTDATVALGKIAVAKSSLDAIDAAIASGNLDEAIRLAQEAKKMAYLAKEEEFHSAKKSSEWLQNVMEKVSKAKAKIATFASFGGDTTTLAAELAKAEDLISQGQVALTSGDYVTAETDFRQVKVIANRVKDAAETAIYALGGSIDTLDDEHKQFTKEVSDDINEIADIESDSSRSAELKKIITEQKQSGLAVASAVQLAQERGAIERFFFGVDNISLDSISEKVAENAKNAETLRTLAQQSEDANIRDLLLSQAGRIEAENTKLQAFVAAQSQSSGLFGWFFDLFQ